MSTTLGEAPYLEEALRWLPESAAPDLEPWEAGSAEPDAIGSPAVAEGIRSARILVVDHNADILDYIRPLLSPNYPVATVSGRRAACCMALNRGSSVRIRCTWVWSAKAPSSSLASHCLKLCQKSRINRSSESSTASEPPVSALSEMKCGRCWTGAVTERSMRHT